MKAAQAASHLLNAAPRIRGYVLAFAEDDETLSFFHGGSILVQTGLLQLLDASIGNDVAELIEGVQETKHDDEEDETCR